MPFRSLNPWMHLAIVKFSYHKCLSISDLWRLLYINSIHCWRLQYKMLSNTYKVAYMSRHHIFVSNCQLPSIIEKKNIGQASHQWILTQRVNLGFGMIIRSNVCNVTCIFLVVLLLFEIKPTNQSKMMTNRHWMVSWISNHQITSRIQSGYRESFRVVIWAGTRVRFYSPGTRALHLHKIVYNNASAKINK